MKAKDKRQSGEQTVGYKRGRYDKNERQNNRNQGEKVSVFFQVDYSNKGRDKSRVFTRRYKNLTGTQTDCTVMALRHSIKKRDKAAIHSITGQNSLSSQHTQS